MTTPLSYASRDTATKYKPKDGDTLATILAAHTDMFATWEDLAIYNWGTSEAREVNRVLQETVGVSALDAADPSKTVLKIHPDAPNPDILLAKPWTVKGLTTGKTYVVKAQRILPPTAIGIDALDRWFIPAKETCDLTYTLEGSKKCATKVRLEVYGSNYSAAGAWNKGLGSFPASADKKDVPLYENTEQADAPERKAALAIAEWKGKVTATEGALGDKTELAGGAKEDRVVNVAFSPYTALLRYYLDDADKNARILLDPFWVRFDASGVPIEASLKVRWNVKGTTRFGGGKGSGQLVIVDGKGAPVFRKPLKDAEMTPSGSMVEVTWAGGTYNEPEKKNSKGGTTAIAEDTPYRVKIEMHTTAGQTKGLALAAMQTEVRLYVAPGTLAADVDPYVATNDKTSLVLVASPALLTTKELARSDGTAWCKKQLALGGFHPGPVDGNAGHAAYETALTEFKRSVPKRKAAPTDDFARFTLDLSEGDDVKDALEDLVKVPDWQRPWFGAGASRADVDAAGAAGTLVDPTKELIVWVDDRHTYTDPDWLAGVAQGATTRTKVRTSPAANGDYMGGYTGGDNVVTKKASAIPRPWIPLAADLILLGKAQDLTTVVGVPSDADRAIMRKAIGPLRIDWTFDEIDADPPSEVPVDVTQYTKTVTRSRAVTKDARAAGKAASYARKDVKRKATYLNCPASAGGIRLASPSAYYKAAFAIAAADALAPWKPLDVSARESIATIVHDNLGQTKDELVVDRIGQAGVYFHPSTIGGDGYRVRAQLQLDAQGDYKLPNLAVLKDRYPLLPQAQSCAMRIWRKASIRAYVCWSDNNGWGAHNAGMKSLFEAGYLHFAYERGDAAVNTKITDWLADDAAFRAIVKQALAPGAAPTTPDGKRAQDAIIKLAAQRMWPWANHPQFGLFEPSAPNTSLSDAATALLAKTINPLFYTLSNLFGVELVAVMEKKKGKLRGHVVVQLLSSDPLLMEKYSCPTCHKSYHYAEKEPIGGAMRGAACPSPGCAGHLQEQVRYRGYYTCTNGHKQYWDDHPGGGKFSGFKCPIKGCAGPGTLSQDQAMREQYTCSACAWNGWLVEAGAGGDHDGEKCPKSGCAGKLAHHGGWKETYRCSGCGLDQELPEAAAAGGSHVGQAHAACVKMPKGALQRKAPPAVRALHTLGNGNKVLLVYTDATGYAQLPVPSLGNPLGVAWNTRPSTELWGHELGHTRFLEHAGNARGANNAQHDPTTNSGFNWAAIKETTADGKQWDRACLMTYADHRPTYDATRDRRYPCGRCALKIRGWKLAGVASPAAAVKDP
jgi:hypothetical protein